MKNLQKPITTIGHEITKVKRKSFIYVIFKASLVLIALLTIQSLYTSHIENVKKEAYWQGVANQFLEDNNVKKVEPIVEKNLSKFGELTTHKGVYINSAILKAIDNKFNKKDAEKLKIVMLAECAKDYKTDGKAIYECKSDTENYNAWNNSWDCGYLQISGKEKCTNKHFAIDYQIEQAYNKLYSLKNEYCGGFKCWSSYKFKDSKTFKTSYNHWASK